MDAAVNWEPWSADATADAGGPDAPFCEDTALLSAFDNARDLGGIRTTGGTVACGKLFRLAAPSALVPQGCANLVRLGIATVIDLRIPTEREATPDAPCVRAQATLVLAPMPVPYELSAANYLADFYADDSVRAVFSVLGNPASYPVMFHCTYGRDRSGVVAALILLALGASREDILYDYQRTQRAGWNTAPNSLMAVLDEIDRRGGIASHLAAIGVDAAMLEVLRKQAIAAAKDASAP